MTPTADSRPLQSPAPPPPPRCGECGKPDPFLLHNVRHKIAYRRLCTHCVLNSFRGHYCPLCLDVFDPVDAASPPRATIATGPNQHVMCLNCPSVSHLSCINSLKDSQSFLCPSCENPNPNFTFFKLNPRNPNLGSNPEVSTDILMKSIDKRSAKALYAASQIAAAVMSKAASSARLEAERRVKEAAVARKRAREALERVAYMALREKEREKERDLKGFDKDRVKRLNLGNDQSVERGRDGAVIGSSQLQTPNGGAAANGLHSGAGSRSQSKT